MNIERYFRSWYGPRTSPIGRLFLRHGQQERVRILRRLLTINATDTLLDVGCGDGVTLAAALHSPPARIRLEDIAPTAIADASSHLQTLCRDVTGVVGDSFRADATAEVVVAIGVLDYRSDAVSSFGTLLRRARRELVATIPRSDHPRNWARAAWFKSLGMPFSAMTRRAIRSIPLPPDSQLIIERGPFEWFVKVTTAGERW